MVGKTPAITVVLFFACVAAVGQNAGPSAPGAELRFARVTDLSIPAGAADLVLERRFSTGCGPPGLLGGCWRLNWDARLVVRGDKASIEGWTCPAVLRKDADGMAYSSSSGERVVAGADGRAVRTTAAGLTETFDAAGRLVERPAPGGKTVLLEYDQGGGLSRVGGPAGSSLAFTLDPQGRVTRAVASTGAAVEYAYEGADLVEVRVNGGARLAYSYGPAGELTGVRDPAFGDVSIAYDGQGRVASYRWADGAVEKYEYDDAALAMRYIDPMGAVTTTCVEGESLQTEITDPLGRKRILAFDPATRVSTETDPTGAAIRTTLDPQGRAAAVVDALQQTTRFEYTGKGPNPAAMILADGSRRDFAYDAQGRLLLETTGGAVVRAFTYTAEGQVKTARAGGEPEERYAYHANGLLKSIANPRGETTFFEYDTRGNLVKEVNPRNGATVRAYDTQDRLVSVTDPAGSTVRFGYDAAGREAARTDPDMGITKYEYDARGRLAVETTPGGRVTRYTYDAAGRLTSIRRPDGRVESAAYDAAGNVIERTDLLGRPRRYDVDTLGRVTVERWAGGLEVRYRYDAAGNLVERSASPGGKTAFAFDAAGRRIAEGPAGGPAARARFDGAGRLLAWTDPLGHATQYEFTPDGMMARAVDAAAHAVAFEYDEAARPTAVSRGAASVFRFAYDAAGNLVKKTDPLLRERRFDHDPAGRLIRATDPGGEVTGFAYDEAGRLSAKRLPDGREVAYAYDASSRIVRIDDGRSPVELTYDAAGRLVRVHYGAFGKSVSYAYGENGLPSKLIDPDGREIRYERNALLQIASIALPDGKKIAFIYDALGRTKTTAFPNGVTGLFQYDEASGAVTSIAYQDPAGKRLRAWTYRYDAAGNVTAETDEHGATTTYAYDDAGQLVEEERGGTPTRYGYDARGNRVSVESGGGRVQYTVDAADQMLQAGALRLSYDGRGNLVGREGTDGAVSYEYDAENRLVKAVSAAGDATAFAYAPTGARMSRTGPDGAAYFVYDGLNLFQVLDQDFKTVAVFVHAPGIDRPLAMLRGGKAYFYHADRLGSIRAVTDMERRVVAAYDYDAFGTIGAARDDPANPFTFAGRERDATGLLYMRARYYDAALGRFVSPDPAPPVLADPLDHNAYLYARNNPVRFVDPTGLDPAGPGPAGGPVYVRVTPPHFDSSQLASWSAEELHQLYVDVDRDPVSWSPRDREIIADVYNRKVAQMSGNGETPSLPERGGKPASGGRASGIGSPGERPSGAPGQAGPATEAVGRPPDRSTPRVGLPGRSASSGSPSGGLATSGASPPVRPGARTIGHQVIRGNTVQAPRPPRAGGLPGGSAGPLTIVLTVAQCYGCYQRGLGPAACAAEVGEGLLASGAAAGIGYLVLGTTGAVVATVALTVGGTVAAVGMALYELWGKWDAEAEVQHNEANTELTRLERRLAKTQKSREDLMALLDALDKESAKAVKAKDAARSWLRAIREIRAPSGSWDAWCREAAELQAGIRDNARSAEGKEQDVRRWLDAALKAAADCRASADAELIQNNYESAVRVLGEVGAMEKEAVSASRRLAELRGFGDAPDTPSTDAGDLPAKLEAEVKESVEAASLCELMAERWRKSSLEFERDRDVLTEEITLFREDPRYTPIPQALEQRFNALVGGLNASGINLGSLDPGGMARAARDASETARADGEQGDKAASRFQRSACDRDPLADKVEAIGLALQSITIEVGAAAELPAEADACMQDDVCFRAAMEVRKLTRQGDFQGARSKIDAIRGSCPVSELEQEIAAPLSLPPPPPLAPSRTSSPALSSTAPSAPPAAPSRAPSVAPASTPSAASSPTPSAASSPTPSAASSPRPGPFRLVDTVVKSFGVQKPGANPQCSIKPGTATYVSGLPAPYDSVNYSVTWDMPPTVLEPGRPVRIHAAATGSLSKGDRMQVPGEGLALQAFQALDERRTGLRSAAFTPTAKENFKLAERPEMLPIGYCWIQECEYHTGGPTTDLRLSTGEWTRALQSVSGDFEFTVPPDYTQPKFTLVFQVSVTAGVCFDGVVIYVYEAAP